MRRSMETILSIKSFDDAHDFFPAAPAAAPRSGLLAAVRLFFQAASEGLTSLHRYETLRHHGRSHAEAAAAAMAITKADR